MHLSGSCACSANPGRGDHATVPRIVRITSGANAPDSNRIARIAAKVVGTVAQLNKQLGDTVAKDEVVAVLDSREVAEAKSEYLAAQVNFELQKTLFERAQPLYQAKVTPENQYLRTKTTFTEAQLRVELARHKLSALNVSEREITELSRQTTSLQRYEIRSPIEGRVVERLVNLGAPVGGEGQAKELYVVADLSSVWIELSVPTADLPTIMEGQPVAISAGANGKVFRGQDRLHQPDAQSGDPLGPRHCVRRQQGPDLAARVIRDGSGSRRQAADQSGAAPRRASNNQRRTSRVRAHGRRL